MPKTRSFTGVNLGGLVSALIKSPFITGPPGGACTLFIGIGGGGGGGGATATGGVLATEGAFPLTACEFVALTVDLGGEACFITTCSLGIGGGGGRSWMWFVDGDIRGGSGVETEER